jgi:uncharacterized membrane protein
VNLQRYKLLFIAVVLLVSLFVASPALQRVIVYPPSLDSFSELWILGPDKTAYDYPYNFANNVDYTVYLGVANHLGSCAYYQIYVKLCNSTEQLPSSFNQHRVLSHCVYNNCFCSHGGAFRDTPNFFFRLFL